MRVKIIGFFRKIGANLIYGIRRFPEALILAACAVILGIYMNHYGNDLPEKTREILSRIIMIIALGVPLSLCINAIFERIPKYNRLMKIVAYVAGAAALVLYYLFLLDKLKLVPVERYVAVTLALYVIFTFLPYFYKRANYELYIIKLLTGFIITYFYSLILYLGLDAIIFTIDKLFNANISSKIYFDMFLIVAGIFALGYFLSGIPEREEELTSENYSKILKVLLLNIVMPLTVAYSTILYAYFIKILATQVWPKGLVANLVLWFSIICAAVIFLIYVLKEKNVWTKFYVKWMPIFILPLMLMMYAAIGIRINTYGVTENRYYVVVAGLWVFGYMIYMSIRKQPRNIVLAVSLAIIAILAVYGPLSGFNISINSQNARLENILVKNGMLVNNTIKKATTTLKDTDKRNISEIISYFEQNHSLANVNCLPDGFKLDEADKVFGFTITNYPQYYPDGNEYFNHTLSEEGQFIDIKDYDYFLQYPYYKLTTIKSGQTGLEITYYADSKELKISRDGNIIYTAKPEDFALKVHNANKGKELLNAEEMSVIDENSAMKVLYVFRNVNGSVDDSGTMTMNMSEYNMFIKLK